MREKILKLREQGMTYNEICDELGCAKSTVSYHCGDRQKEKTRLRSKKRISKIIESKVYRFNSEKTVNIRGKVGGFSQIDRHYNKPYIPLFGYKDVLNKFGENTICYLTGTHINLINDKYSFDHIVPRSKNGSCGIENLGITIPEVNKAKNDLSVDEFIDLCKKVLTHNGYNIIKQ